MQQNDFYPPNMPTSSIINYPVKPLESCRFYWPLRSFNTTFLRLLLLLLWGTSSLGTLQGCLRGGRRHFLSAGLNPVQSARILKQRGKTGTQLRLQTDAETQGGPHAGPGSLRTNHSSTWEKYSLMFRKLTRCYAKRRRICPDTRRLDDDWGRNLWSHLTI